VRPNLRIKGTIQGQPTIFSVLTTAPNSSMSKRMAEILKLKISGDEKELIRIRLANGEEAYAPNAQTTARVTIQLKEGGTHKGEDYEDFKVFDDKEVTEACLGLDFLEKHRLTVDCSNWTLKRAEEPNKLHCNNVEVEEQPQDILTAAIDLTVQTNEKEDITKEELTITRNMIKALMAQARCEPIPMQCWPKVSQNILTIPVTLNGVEIKALLDTGSSLSMISRETCIRNGFPMFKLPASVAAFSVRTCIGTTKPMDPLGTHLKVGIQGTQYYHPFFVEVEDTKDGIVFLGCDFLFDKQIMFHFGKMVIAASNDIKEEPQEFTVQKMPPGDLRGFMQCMKHVIEKTLDLKDEDDGPLEEWEVPTRKTDPEAPMYVALPQIERKKDYDIDDYRNPQKSEIEKTWLEEDEVEQDEMAFQKEYMRKIVREFALRVDPHKPPNIPERTIRRPEGQQSINFEGEMKHPETQTWDGEFSPGDIVTLMWQFDSRHPTELQAEPGESLAFVKNGTGDNQGWCQVLSPGRRGWLPKDYLIPKVVPKTEYENLRKHWEQQMEEKKIHRIQTNMRKVKRMALERIEEEAKKQEPPKHTEQVNRMQEVITVTIPKRKGPEPEENPRLTGPLRHPLDIEPVTTKEKMKEGSMILRVHQRTRFPPKTRKMVIAEVMNPTTAETWSFKVAVPREDMQEVTGLDFHAQKISLQNKYIVVLIFNNSDREVILKRKTKIGKLSETATAGKDVPYWWSETTNKGWVTCNCLNCKAINTGAYYEIMNTEGVLFSNKMELEPEKPDNEQKNSAEEEEDVDPPDAVGPEDMERPLVPITGETISPKRYIKGQEINGLHTLTPEQQNAIIEILEENTKIIPEDGERLGTCRILEHQIRIDENKGPFSLKHYPMSQRDRLELEEHIQQLVKAGIVSPSQSPWGAPTQWVAKKNQTKRRLVVDYRAVNSITEPDVYPLPRIEQVLECVKDAQYFISIDLNSGFHQISVNPKHRHLTAMIVVKIQIYLLRNLKRRK